MCTHPCFHKTPSYLWCNLCSGKKKMVSRRISRSSRTPTSSRIRLSTSPNQLSVVGLFTLATFLLCALWFILCKWLYYVVLLLTLYYYLKHCAMMSHLCSRCVREFLILARTWFTFGLPSKIERDISGIKALLTVGPLS
jgi:hypothetical protein